MIELITTASTQTPSERNQLARRITTGELVRISRGVYASAQRAGRRRPAEVHRDLVRARHLTAPAPLVFCGASAAAMWRLPRVGPWPARVEVIDRLASGGRSQAGIRRRSLGFPSELDVIEDIMLTSLTDTVVGVSRWESFTNGVVTMDAALHGVPRSSGGILATSRLELTTRIGELGSERGAAKAWRALDFSDARGSSPGESLSRVDIHVLGFPPPELQFEFFDREGRMVVDFFWPHLGLAGEFDGVGKYFDERYTHGRSAAEVLMEEKRREERLRALGLRVVRWGWKEAMNPALLRTRLSDAGLS